MPTKIRILSFIFLGLFIVVIGRLGWWQIFQSKTLSNQAKAQYNSSQITSAPRGNILSSDGSLLAVRTQGWVLWANPKLLKESPRSVANKIAPLTAEDLSDSKIIEAEADRLEALLLKDTSWVSLKQKVNDSTKKNIEAMNIKGMGYDSQEITYYPEASMSAQVLGFVGKDQDGSDIGYFGLEGYYNLPLSGKSGYIGGQKDALGAPILLDGGSSIAAVAGVDLVTNIDKRIESTVETHLKDGIAKYGAVGGSITVMDPGTGKILAMASFPSFDPAKYGSFENTVFKNPVISDSFEPGSIFKVLVMAAGLDAGVIKPDTACDICGGALKLDKYFIKTWNDKYQEGITMTEVIVHSDNVGMSFIGQKLGADSLYGYLSRYGIGSKTGIDLQGEIAPKLREKGTWNIVDLATASFGQGVAVTGIQMVRAVSAIANGGYLVTPRVVSSIKGDGWEEKVRPDNPVRVISEQAAKETTQMMVEAVEQGEAKWVAVPDFKIAGKTGTAQIPVAGHYDLTNTNHSFIGFAPADKPKFVMLVTLRSPQSSPWASETAAPLWFSIAKDLFPYLGIQPSR